MLDQVLARLRGVLHRDGWINPVTGLGMWGRDRAESSVFEQDQILRFDELARLYFDDICAIIVDAYPDEALRRGVVFPAVSSDFSDLAIKHVNPAARWGRLFGGGAIFIGADDGRPVDHPLDTSQPRSITWLETFDPRYVQKVPATGGPSSLSHCEFFRFTRLDGGQFTAHRSRVIVIGGASTPEQERETNGGWDLSELQRPYKTIKRFDAGYAALGTMLTDASQGVFKIQSLLRSLAGDKREDIITRLHLMDLARGITNSIMLDADGGESFERSSQNFGGIPESLDRLASRLAATTRIPVTILMGEAPAGLNATGDNDTRAWYSRIETYQKNELLPAFVRLQRVHLGPAADDAPPPSFPRLWTPSDTEAATIAKTKIDGAAVLADHEAITAEELAQLAPLVGIKLDPNRPEFYEQGPAVAVAAGEKRIEITPSDLATITTVNEARGANGLPPLPGPDGSLTVAEFKAKHASVIATAAEAEAGTAPAGPAVP